MGSKVEIITALILVCRTPQSGVPIFAQNKKHPKALFVFDKENKSFKLYPNLGTILANG